MISLEGIFVLVSAKVRGLYLIQEDVEKLTCLSKNSEKLKAAFKTNDQLCKVAMCN